MKYKIICLLSILSICLSGCTLEDIEAKSDEILVKIVHSKEDIDPNMVNVEINKVKEDFNEVMGNVNDESIDSITGEEKPEGYDGYEGMFDNFKNNISGNQSETQSSLKKDMDAMESYNTWGE